MQENDSSSSDTAKAENLPSSFVAKRSHLDLMPDIKQSWTANIIYPFSQVLRFRVVQIVCGIVMMVMGSVACIEEKGTVTNLGLGVFAGTGTVAAAAACIHTSRGFGGYRHHGQRSSYGSHSMLRFLGPSLMACLWMIAGCLNVILLTRALLTFAHWSDQISETSRLLAIVQAILSTSVLLTVAFIARVDCTHHPH